MLRKRHNRIRSLSASFLLLTAITAAAQVNPFKIVKDADFEREATKIFDSALNYYRLGDYWQSSQELIKVIDDYAEFSRMAQAIYTLGNCLYELNMLEGAFKLYERLIKKHISSIYVPDALLGLQRVEYDRNNYAASLEYYNSLARGNPSSDILDLANYYAGMAFYKLADYPGAVNVLSKATPNSPYYDYILYSLAVCMLRMQKINEAIDVFQRLFELPVMNDERRHVIDQGHQTLGYLYYELTYFDRAIEQFRMVTPSSDQHPQALLATGWAASQQNNWQQAIPPLTELYTHYEISDITQEGLFLLGRCYLKLNRYDEAIKIYDHLIAIFPDQENVITSIETINENIQLERRRIEKRQADLLVLEGNLVDELNKSLPKRRNLSQDQTVLLRDIQKERQDLAEHLTQLDKLAVITALREERRNWRAYAEYGKSRATFLKRQQERHQKEESK
ncbi:tetratricopeptide repeat protein [candidate division KSB1 bacterium]|nr:tetratricopeptide repeat protein [candidate division KSB1 bacterium]